MVGEAGGGVLARAAAESWTDAAGTVLDAGTLVVGTPGGRTLTKASRN